MTDVMSDREAGLLASRVAEFRAFETGEGSAFFPADRFTGPDAAACWAEHTFFSAGYRHAAEVFRGLCRHGATRAAA